MCLPWPLLLGYWLQLIATPNSCRLTASTFENLSLQARQEETSHINRSLWALGTVIERLSSDPGGHIPYRDSKLTRMLQVRLCCRLTASSLTCMRLL